MTALKIYRESELSNKLRNYKIFIDGEFVGTIADGEAKDFAVSLGSHTVMAAIDWCSSPNVEVVLSKNEIKKMQVSSFKIPIKFLLIGILLFVLSFILTTYFKFTMALLLLAPLPIIPLYYVTFGRKKYLSLIEIKN